MQKLQTIARLTALCLATSALTSIADAGAQAAVCSTNSTTGTTAFSCAATPVTTTNTTNGNSNNPATVDRTQSIGQNITAAISSGVTIGGYGLNFVPTGGNHTVAILNSGTVDATGFVVSPIPTIGAVGDGGLISYSGNGTISNPSNSSLVYSGIDFSNINSGSVQIGSLSNPVSAKIFGGVNVETANGRQDIFLDGGQMNSALTLTSSGSGAINVQLTGNAALQGTYGIHAFGTNGTVSILSNATIGTLAAPISFEGIVAKSANDISINVTGGSIAAREGGIEALTTSGAGAITVVVASGASIKTLGIAGLGDGINTAAATGRQNISVAGVIDAAANGIDSNQGAGGLTITVAGSVRAATAGIVALNSGGATIVNTGSITGQTGIDAHSGIATIHNSGTISGAGGTAILFAGTGNTLGIQASSAISGTVFGAGSDTLQLEGPGDASFDASKLGVAQQYRGFSTLLKTGSANWTLVGTSSFSGVTAVSAGTLNVTGSIATSAVTVQSGATLSGIGTVGATMVQSVGTLAPGSGGIGALNINGNLALASGSAFNADISPSASDTVVVSGTAGIGGVLTASAASGTYAAGQRYTLISAAGGLNGTFTSFTTPGLPGYVRGRLGYDGNDAYLFLDPNALTPLLPSGATANQKNVAGGIDAAVQGGAVLGGGFNTLYGQTGAALAGSLDQLSGQIGANTASAVGQSFAPFLALLTQGAPQADALQTTARFAPDGAYGAANAPHPVQSAPGEILVWGAAYGGHAGISGNATSGAASLSASDYGFAVGAETRLGVVTAGAGIAVGQQRFDSGNGAGQSTDVTLGLYGRGMVADNGYLSGSVGYGWHDIATTRAVTVAGTDILQAKMNAHQWGGRIEGGWHVSDLLTPFAAFEGTQFELPAYGEHAVSGASTFALAYAAQDTGEAHSELGARLGRAFALEDGQLSAQGRLAWAHELEATPFEVANFQGLVGSAFAVAGTRVADDTALLGLDLDVHQASGLSFGVAMQSQLGNGTTVWQGMGHIGLRW